MFENLGSDVRTRFFNIGVNEKDGMVTISLSLFPLLT